MPLVMIAEIKGKDGRVILPAAELKCEKEYNPDQVKEIQKVFADIFSTRFINRCTAELIAGDLRLKTLNTGWNNVDITIATSKGNGMSLEKALNILVPALNSDVPTAGEETMVSPITYDKTSVSDELAKRRQSTYGASEVSVDKVAGTVLQTAASFRVLRSNTIELPEFLLQKAAQDPRNQSLQFVQKSTTNEGELEVKSYEISTGGVDSSTLLAELRIFHDKLEKGILKVVEHDYDDDDKDDTMLKFVAVLKGKTTNYFVPIVHVVGVSLEQRENTFESVQSMVQNLFKNELSALKKRGEELVSKEAADAEKARQSTCFPSLSWKKKNSPATTGALVSSNPSSSTGSSNTSTPPKPKGRKSPE